MHKAMRRMVKCTVTQFQRTPPKKNVAKNLKKMNQSKKEREKFCGKKIG